MILFAGHLPSSKREAANCAKKFGIVEKENNFANKYDNNLICWLFAKCEK